MASPPPPSTLLLLWLLLWTSQQINQAVQHTSKAWLWEIKERRDSQAIGQAARESAVLAATTSSQPMPASVSVATLPPSQKLVETRNARPSHACQDDHKTSERYRLLFVDPGKKNIVMGGTWGQREKRNQDKYKRNISKVVVDDDGKVLQFTDQEDVTHDITLETLITMGSRSSSNLDWFHVCLVERYRGKHVLLNFFQEQQPSMPFQK
ncbi:hypothetical protein BJ741DRAFT_646554 [Chytriomyces cf. hyalinus JEL632]|nr:hypothetical protein BJ741DRAFT_646554 [Chytriomyces cf. hyalinus JEL632]